jgi:predicted SprT family Zn-dependent metalloprotease
MDVPEKLLRKIIKEEIEKLHPWQERGGDDDRVRELLNLLYQIYKQKHAQNKKTAEKTSDIKKAITRARKEAGLKKGKV